MSLSKFCKIARFVEETSSGDRKIQESPEAAETGNTKRKVLRTRRECQDFDKYEDALDLIEKEGNWRKERTNSSSEGQKVTFYCNHG